MTTDRAPVHFRLAGVAIQVRPGAVALLVIGTAVYGLLPATRWGVSGPMRFIWGASIMLGLFLGILVHELGHALVARRCGVAVERITLGAMSAVTHLGERPGARPLHTFCTAAAGPAGSLLVAAAAWGAALAVSTGPGAYALGAIAVLNAIVGGINLVPAFPLDGGWLVYAGAWAATGSRNRAVRITGQVGYAIVIALLAAAAWIEFGPVSAAIEQWRSDQRSNIALIMLLMIAYTILAGSSSATRRAMIAERAAQVSLPQLTRRAISVFGFTPVSEAVRLAQAAGAGACVITDGDGAPVGILDEDQVKQVPIERRPWVDCSALSIDLGDDRVLPADLSGDDLVQRVGDEISGAYLVVAPHSAAVLGVVTGDDLRRYLLAVRAR